MKHDYNKNTVDEIGLSMYLVSCVFVCAGPLYWAVIPNTSPGHWPLITTPTEDQTPRQPCLTLVPRNQVWRAPKPLSVRTLAIVPMFDRQALVMASPVSPRCAPGQALSGNDSPERGEAGGEPGLTDR